MKFFVFLTLIGLCAYQFASIQAASAQNSRQKRYAGGGECPKDKNTAEACLAYAKSFNKCADVWTDGEEFRVTGCDSVWCNGKDGKRVPGTADLSKPYPQCCPRCN